MTSSEDDHLANVKMVVCLPPASPTCVSHAVDFLLQEEGILIIGTHSAVISR